jgi:hypothetical protein
MVYATEMFCREDGEYCKGTLKFVSSFSECITDLTIPVYYLCSNNLDDVREEWERIKLSYEILSDKKTKKRYDRHAMIADPQAAMSRAAVDAVGKGISGLGHGLLNVGAFAVRQMTKEKGGK